MSENLITMYVIFGALGIAAIVFGIYLFFEKRRTDEMKRFSEWIGFSFTNKPKDDFAWRLSSLNFFPGAHSHKVYNMLSGEYKGIDWKIFDYRYTIGYGKHSRTYNQTLAYAHTGDFGLPRFSLAAETFFHRLGEVFGFKDIDFKDYPAFSKRYLLKAKEEQTIRDLFTPEVLQFFQRQDKVINVIAQDDFMAMYYANHRRAPNQLRAFIDTASEMVNIFKSRCQS